MHWSNQLTTHNRLKGRWKSEKNGLEGILTSYRTWYALLYCGIIQSTLGWTTFCSDSTLSPQIAGACNEAAEGRMIKRRRRRKKVGSASCRCCMAQEMPCMCSFTASRLWKTGSAREEREREAAAATKKVKTNCEVERVREGWLLQNGSVINELQNRPARKTASTRFEVSRTCQWRAHATKIQKAA